MYSMDVHRGRDTKVKTLERACQCERFAAPGRIDLPICRQSALFSLHEERTRTPRVAKARTMPAKTRAFIILTLVKDRGGTTRG